MNSEIELKFLAPDNCLDALNELLGQFPQLQHESRHLYSTYFDTPNRQLRKFDMGLRIRSGDGEKVQTLKTAGRVIGGLHERPEYNLGITGDRPILHRFEQVDWPEGTDLKDLENNLSGVFVTDFERLSWLLDLDNDTLVEVAYDRGELIAGSKREVISEIEIELVKGDVAQLFVLARTLCQMGDLLLANVSKAKRGYMLADDLPMEEVQPLDFVSLTDDDSMTQAFGRCFEYALLHWQRHQELYSQGGGLRAIVQLRQGVMLLHQVLNLFGGRFNFECPWRDELLWLARQLSWLDEAISLEGLLEQQGEFIKKLPKRRLLIKLLEARLAELLGDNSAQGLISSMKYSQLMVDIVTWFRLGEWQTKENMSQSLSRFSREALSLSWDELSQSALGNEKLDAHRYTQLSGLLQRNLMVGLCLGQLFDTSRRNEFRLPWFDVSKGMEDLRLLRPVETLIDELEDQDDIAAINRWLGRKQESIASAMDWSRLQALQLSPYWS